MGKKDKQRNNQVEVQVNMNTGESAVKVVKQSKKMVVVRLKKPGPQRYIVHEGKHKRTFRPGRNIPVSEEFFKTQLAPSGKFVLVPIDPKTLDSDGFPVQPENESSENDSTDENQGI